MTRAARAQEFGKVYGPCLEECLRRYPEQYFYPPSFVPDVVNRMILAFTAGTYSQDGPAVRMACKRLGINHTRRAMEAFFNSSEETVLV
jgi:hypothetical protein